MRVKNFLLMFIVLMFLASLAMVNVPVKSSPPPVTFYIEMPPQGYIDGVSPAGTQFPVDVLIDASGLTYDAAGSMVGYQIDVQVDPAVLEVMGSVGGAGYFLDDFRVDKYQFTHTINFLTGTVNKATGHMDEIVEQIVATPPTGAGGTGTLVTLYFKSKDPTTAYSPIQMGLFEAGVWEANWMDTTGTWHDAATIVGHYNAPPFSYLHSVSSLIDLSSPVTTSWHELYPTYSNSYSLNSWIDGQSAGELGYGKLSPCDSIELNSTWYHVEGVTVTIETRHPTDVTEGESTNSPSSTSVAAAGWNNPAHAYTSNDTYAITATDDSMQEYGNYGFNIPSSAVITQVEVGMEAHTDDNEKIRFWVSWNNGTDWSGYELSGNLPSGDPDTVTWFDFSGEIDWYPENLTDFRVRARVEKAGGSWGDVYLDWIPVRVTFTAPSPIYIEFLPGFKHMDDVIDDANLTLWHEVYPVFSQWYNLTGWVDNDATNNLTINDDFDLTNLTDLTTETYYVEDVHTDIMISGPIAEPPEFPLGIAMEIGLIVAIAYVWWRSRRKTKTTKQTKPLTGHTSKPAPTI